MKSGDPKRCPACGSRSLRIEFRDQFVRELGGRFDPLANGMWIVCTKCDHQWPGDNNTGLYEQEGARIES